MGRKKLPRQKKRPRPKELLQAWGGAKARTAAARQTGRGTDAAQKEMPQHCCLRLLPARQRPDRQGSAAAPLWCIRPRFSVGPIAAGPPCPPPFPNPRGLPCRPVGGGVFSSPGAQTSPFWGARGGRSLEAFFLRAPGTCPGKNGASKGGKAGRIAKNRKGSRRTGCRPEEEQRKDGARPKRGAAPLWRTRAAADMAASGGGCLNPEAVACSGSGCPGSHSGQDGPLQGLLRAAAALCGVPRRKSAPTARPGGRDAALLPDGGSRYNGRGGYAQRLPRAVPL